MTIFHLFRKPLLTLFDWLLPVHCLLCDSLAEGKHGLCYPCHRDLPILPQCCVQCGHFLQFNSSSNPVCGDCLTHPPVFQHTHALFPYAFPVRQLIARLKFGHELDIAHALGGWMADRIQSTWYATTPLPELIIPVPLHPDRLKERGFNQALEIARPIAARLNIPIDYQGLIRTKATPAQSGLNASQRKRNVAHAFALTRHYQDKQIALLDDVMTTGCTIRECATLLKNKGATRIDVWCVARKG